MTAPVVDQVAVAVVPDFRRFPAEMRRGVDEAMRELASRINLALDEAGRQFAESGRELGRDFQRGGEEAEAAFRELDRTARRELDDIDRHTTAAAGGLKTKLGGAAKFAGAAVLGAGVAAAAGLGLLTAMGLKAAASMEQSQIAFKALLGSAELGKKVFADLQQFAALTPFQLTEIVPVAQRFFTFADALGMAKTQVKEFLTVLGDLASVTGSGAFGMERAALAMSQMAAKGRLSAQDVNQLADAFPGFNVRAAIAAELGLTVAETMTRMENGSIDASTGLHALIEGMKKFPGAAGAMEAQSQTLLGVFSTFKDTFNLALVDAFQPVIPNIKAALTDLTPTIGAALKDLAPLLGNSLTTMLKLAAPVLSLLSKLLTPLVDAFNKSLDQLASSGALTQIGDALTEFGVALAPLIPLLTEFLIASLQIAVPILLLLAQVLRLISPLLDLFTRSLAELSRALGMIDWHAVGRAINSFFKDIWSSVTGFFSDLAHLFEHIPTQVGETFTKMRTTAQARLNALMADLTALPGRLIGALGKLDNLLLGAGKDLIHGLWAGISSLGGWLASKVKQFAIDNTLGAIKHALGISSPSQVMADQVGKWIPAGIGMGVQQGMPDLRAMLASATGPGPTAAAVGAAGAMAAAGPISVVINFTGAAPTAQQAYDTGLKAGQGVMDAINRRNVTTAVRQRG